jgi:hypothetical protein
MAKTADTLMPSNGHLREEMQIGILQVEREDLAQATVEMASAPTLSHWHVIICSPIVEGLIIGAKIAKRSRCKKQLWQKSCDAKAWHVLGMLRAVWARNYEAARRPRVD